MAKIFNGMIPFASAIQPTGAQPLDDRVVVATMADLIDATTFGDAKYNGMLVAVVETQQVYMLVDDVNSTNSDSWVQVGTDFSGDISDLSDRVDDIETDVENLTAKLNVSNVSGLGVDDNNALSVKLVADSDNFINGLVATENGLAAASYQLRKRETGVDDAYAAQYDFTAFTPNGSVVTTINIPKDQFLKDASFHATAEDGVAVEAPYLKFVWDLDINEDLDGIQNVTYVPVKDLVDTYTSGEYITITDNVIDVNYTKVALHLSDTLKLVEKWEAIHANTTAIGDANSGLVADVAKNTRDISTNATNIETLTRNIGTINDNITTINQNVNGLEAFDTVLKIEGVVNRVDNTASYGINLTSEEVGDNGAVVAKINVDIDTLASAVIEAADIPAPIASNIAVSAFGATYTENTNVQAVLESLDSRIKAAVSGGVTSVVAGVGINVNATDANNPTVSVKTSDLVVSGSALTVTDNKIDICWSEL